MVGPFRSKGPRGLGERQAAEGAETCRTGSGEWSGVELPAGWSKVLLQTLDCAFLPAHRARRCLETSLRGGGGAGHEEWEKAALEGRAVSE